MSPSNIHVLEDIIGQSRLGRNRGSADTFWGKFTRPSVVVQLQTPTCAIIEYGDRPAKLSGRMPGHSTLRGFVQSGCLLLN